MKTPQSHFLSMLFEEAGKQKLPVLLACVVSGLAQGAVLSSILLGLKQLAHNGIELYVLLFFVISLFLSYALFQYCTQRMTIFSLRAVTKLRMGIVSKLRGLSLQNFTKIKEESSQLILHNSQEMVVEVARILTSAFSNSVMMFVAIAQMIATSLLGACIVFLLMGIGFTIYIRIVQDAKAYTLMSKETERNFSNEFQNFEDAFMDTKISLKQSVYLFQTWLFPSLKRSSLLREETENAHTHGMTFFSTYTLAILGILLFAVPWVAPLSLNELTHLLVLVIFCITPLMNIVSLVPIFTKVETNITLLYNFDKKLDKDIEEFERKYVENSWEKDDLDYTNFKSLLIKNLYFAYRNKEEDKVYSLSIPEFRLDKNEIIMLYGNNGSGKSSFLNLISTLYLPEKGSFILNDYKIFENNDAEKAPYTLEDWRNLFAFVPSKVHFSRHPNILASSHSFLEMAKLVKLMHKVQYLENDDFEFMPLSSGEEKRLALLYALLEDKDIYLFDEIEADFDKEFRQHFYLEIIPYMKKQGKSIIIASRDDSYHSYADKIIHMSEGKIL